MSYVGRPGAGPLRAALRGLDRPARPQLAGFSDDAKAAMTANPDYFVWWYTAKSIGLGVVAAVAAYYIGKERGRRAGRSA